MNKKEYIVFFDEIKRKTKIEFSVYSSKGNVIYGTDENKIEIPVFNDDVYVDEASDCTFFVIKALNDKYYGRIGGTTINERNYAFLISSLAEKTLTKSNILSKDEFCRALVFGELSASETLRYMHKFSFNEGNCTAMIIKASNNISEVANAVKMYSFDKRDFVITLDEKSLVLVKFMRESSSDYRSFSEFAEYLVASIYEEVGQSVIIYMGGTVKSLTDIAISYAQAYTTQRLALQNNYKRGVHPFKQYVLYKILEDLPRYKLNEYMELLDDSRAEDIFNDEEMKETAEEFLENSLNQSETARKLFLHRNTLNYRLDKIEKATGLNIRKFSDAVTFRLITLIRELVK